MSFLFEEVSPEEVQILKRGFSAHLEEGGPLMAGIEAGEVEIGFYAPHPVVRPLLRDFSCFDLKFPSSSGANEGSAPATKKGKVIDSAALKGTTEVRVLATANGETKWSLWLARDVNGSRLHRINRGPQVSATEKALQKAGPGGPGVSKQVALFSFDEINLNFLWIHQESKDGASASLDHFVALTDDSLRNWSAFTEGQSYSFGEMMRIILTRELRTQAAGTGR